MLNYFEIEIGLARSQTPIPSLFLKASARFATLLLLGLTLFLSLGTIARAADSSDTPEHQLGWELALHARTFMRFPLFEAMDKTAALGLHYMSLSAAVNLEGTNSTSLLKLSDAQIQSIKDHAHADGLTLVNAYLSFPANEAACRKDFELARKMGLDTLVGEPEPAALDTVEKLCNEYKIRVAIHDHPRPSHYWNPETVLAAIKGRGPYLGACADTGHWVRSGLDPVECLKKLQGHIFALHFKDLNEADRKGHDVPWGTGVGRVKEMMAELQRQNFHGAFCIEYEYHWDTSTPEIAQSVKYFRQIAAELVSNPGQPK